MTLVAMAPPAADGTRLLSVAAVPGSARGRATVEVDGEVDSYTAPLLEACLNAQSGRPGLRTLVVDLDRVRFLGVAGAAVLARAHARCAARGAHLVVRCPEPGIVRRVLQVTGLAELLGASEQAAAPTASSAWRAPTGRAGPRARRRAPRAALPRARGPR